MLELNHSFHISELGLTQRRELGEEASAPIQCKLLTQMFSTYFKNNSFLFKIILRIVEQRETTLGHNVT